MRGRNGLPRRVVAVLWHGLPTVPRGPTAGLHEPVKPCCGTVSRPCHGARPQVSTNPSNRVVARSPDRATLADRRSPALLETFGRGPWHGQETVPQPLAAQS